MDLSGRIDALWARTSAVAHGPSKVTTLPDAIRTHVRDGMHVHLSSGLTRPAALCYELLRAYAGRPSPELTLSTMTFAGPHILLVHHGLVRHLVCCYHGDTLPTPGPNPLVGEAYADGRLTVSEWSILSFTQRLYAGALRLPFITTNSLAGSTMATQDEVREVDGATVVDALRPDLAFVHAPAADPFGNVLLGGPYGDRCLGAWAAREGAIVSVERIVSPEVVASHPHAMRLPATLVRAVVECPFGAHPGPLFSGGVSDLVAPVAEDVPFVVGFREVCRDHDETERWAKEWVYGTDHASYLAKLGSDRLAGLRGRATLASWHEDAVTHAPKIFREAEPSPGERAVVAGARMLARRMRELGLETVLAGVGLSNLAAWCARAQLAATDVGVTLMVELGLYDYVPPPADPLLVSNRVAATARGLAEVLDILGLGLAATPSAGIVGAGQIDARGNVNSTLGSDGRLLVGSGGLNDVASVCRDVVVVCHQSSRRWVSELPYVTAPGRNVGAVASQLGVYEKRDDELVLTGVWGPVDDGVTRAKDACGWDLRVADDVVSLPEPTSDELEMVRGFDPHGDYTG